MKKGQFTYGQMWVAFQFVGPSAGPQVCRKVRQIHKSGLPSFGLLSAAFGKMRKLSFYFKTHMHRQTEYLIQRRQLVACSVSQSVGWMVPRSDDPLVGLGQIRDMCFNFKTHTQRRTVIKWNEKRTIYIWPNVGCFPICRSFGWSVGLPESPTNS